MSKNCGNRFSATTSDVCELPVGHDGRHQYDNFSWPNDPAKHDWHTQLEDIVARHNATAERMNRARNTELAITALVNVAGGYQPGEFADHIIAMAQRLGDYIEKGS